MRFAIAIPQFYGDGQFGPGAFRACLARVEELAPCSAGWNRPSAWPAR